MINNPLSPLDGRYVRDTEPLREYFSERAYTRLRVQVEIDYLIALSRWTHLVRPLTDAEEKALRQVTAEFSAESERQVKELERHTRHDVKAIEYFLRARLDATSLADIVEWLHFGLTSEDVNAIAQALALRDSRDAVLVPALDAVIASLSALASKYKSTPMLARTHGQPAVPSTLGKELAVFAARLRKQRILIVQHHFEAKLNGAVGNFNALVAAAPNVDWLSFSARFISAYGLDANPLTTQLLPYDNWIRYFDTLRLTNAILIDLAQDIWRYISDDYLKSRVVAGEVGSSTMPQKVNPIDFENAEGNLGLANALFAHYAQKLAVSRLQRDLSDSTVRRTFGVALGHTMVAFASLVKGLEQVVANEARMQADLSAHWEVVAEGAQTILRAAGVPAAYEELKALTRGKILREHEFKQWVDGLAVEDGIRERLRALTPYAYVGLAEQLVDRALAEG